MTKEELQGLKVKDIIVMPEFQTEMKQQIKIENNSYKDACREAALKKMRLRRTTVDSLREKGVYNAEMMCRLFEAVLNKSLLGFSANERQYIYGIGMLCMGKVLATLKESIKEE